MFRLNLVLIIISVSLLSCKKDERPQSEIDEEVIQQYIADNNLEAKRHDSGLYYIISYTGTVSRPSINSKVNVTYTGYLTDGTKFDSGTIERTLFELIEGWQIGIPMLGVGGKAKFIIPSGLGYGERGSLSIPGNAVIIFDLTLNSFK